MTQQHNPNYQHAPTPEKTVLQVRFEKLSFAYQLSEQAETMISEPVITVSHEAVEKPVERRVAPQDQPTNVEAIRQLVDASFVAPSVEGQPEVETTVPDNVIELHRPVRLAPNELPINEIYRDKKSA